MEDSNWAVEIGRPTFGAIEEMVRALDFETAAEDFCKALTLEEALAWLKEHREPGNLEATTLEELQKLILEELTEDELGFDEEEARRTIEEDPLSVQVRSGWHTPGAEAEAEEYEILLGTGGPATRIRGDLDRGQPQTARLEVQDWFKPWTEYLAAEEDTLLKYASVFYFGD